MSLDIISYIVDKRDLIISLTIDHFVLFLIAMFFAILIGLILGILTLKSKRFSFLVPITNLLQAAPELVLLALAVVIFGLGVHTALIALFVKGILPILRNTYSGIEEVDKTVIEAAKGMGMSKLQILFKIELPLALPVILGGIRVSAIMAISTLTLAAYIGVSSLGVLITQGIAMSDTNALVTGSLMTAFLAILINYVILWIEKHLTKKGEYIHEKNT